MPRPMPETTRGPRTDTLAAMDAYLALAAQGARPGSAMQHIGRSYRTLEIWRSKYPDFAERERQARERRTVIDSHPFDGTFASFRHHFLGRETYPHMQQMIDAIAAGERAKNMSITSIHLPPAHGKTALLEDYICYRIALDPNIRILYVAGRIEHAKKVLNTVKRRLTDGRSSLVARYGPFYYDGQERDGFPWTNEYVRVANATSDERDYTLETRAITGNVAGNRADLILMDDVQEYKTLTMTEDRLNRMRQDFFSRLGHEGAIVNVGTRIGVGDVHERLLLDDAVDNLVLLPAINADGEPLWPEAWPLDKLMRRKGQMTPYLWAATYQQAPTDDSVATFASDIIEGASAADRTASPVTDGSQTIIGVDPAITGHTAFVVGHISLDGVLTVIDAEDHEALGRSEAIMQKLDRLVHIYRPTEVVVERAAFQAALSRDDRLQQMASDYGFVIREHVTANRKADPTYGVASMPTDMLRRRLLIADGNEYTRARLSKLRSQMTSWRADMPTRQLQQDLVMALWFCWMRWKSLTPNAVASLDAWKHNALPYTPTRWTTRRSA